MSLEEAVAKWVRARYQLVRPHLCSDPGGPAMALIEAEEALLETYLGRAPTGEAHRLLVEAAWKAGATVAESDVQKRPATQNDRPARKKRRRRTISENDPPGGGGLF